MKTTLLTLAFALLAFIPLSFATDNQNKEGSIPNTAKTRAVMFFSETCGSCKILEPRMKEALNAINQERVEVIVFDFSNKAAIETTKKLATKNNINDILNQYGARTGFISLLDSNGKEIDLINVDDNTPDIAAKLAKAIASAS